MKHRTADPQQPRLVQLRRPGGPAELVVAVAPPGADHHDRQHNIGTTSQKISPAFMSPLSFGTSGRHRQRERLQANRFHRRAGLRQPLRPSHFLVRRRRQRLAHPPSATASTSVADVLRAWGEPRLASRVSVGIPPVFFALVQPCSTPGTPTPPPSPPDHDAGLSGQRQDRPSGTCSRSANPHRATAGAGRAHHPGRSPARSTRHPDRLTDDDRPQLKGWSASRAGLATGCAARVAATPAGPDDRWCGRVNSRSDCPATGSGWPGP